MFGLGLLFGKPIAAVDLDEADDDFTKGSALSGMSASKMFTLVAWVRATALEGGGGRNYIFHIANAVGSSNSILGLFYNGSTSTFGVLARNSGGTDVLFASNFTPSLDTWYCIMISVDLSDTGKRHFYVGDSAGSPSWSTYTNADIDFGDTTADAAIGAQASGVSSGDWAGCLGPIWFKEGLYTDFSVEANRRKFYRASGKPADLGSLGDRPFPGTYPTVCNFLREGDPVSVYAANRGTGGGFTANGTITICSAPF